MIASPISAQRAIPTTLLCAFVLCSNLAGAAPPSMMLPGSGSGSLQHIDPLDQGRAGATHRGPNPHAKLSPEQHIIVAVQHLRAGRTPQALAVMDRAVVAFPDNAAVYDARGDLRLAGGNTSLALADVEKAVALAPDNALYRVKRSQLYLKFEREQEAMADLDHAISVNPDLLPARFNRGTLLAYQGKNREALVDFDRCIAIDPHLPGPYFNRGSVYYSLGEKQLAKADIERFIQVSTRANWKQSGQDLLKAWNEAEKNEQAQASIGTSQDGKN